MSSVARPSSRDPSSGLKRESKAKEINPIEASIRSWLQTVPKESAVSLDLNLEGLLLTAPKRWVVYPPMVLLPSGSFANDQLTQRIEQKHKDTLWEAILERVGKKEGKGSFTHLAINSGIPLDKTPENENILRTPSALIILYGDFGPNLSADQLPTSQDFEEAFWVRTRQNGITQIWAPRFTMFSRGNVKEKARLLDFHSFEQGRENRKVGKEDLGRETAVDLYAGIGYFVFSYVKMGIRRVVGWELNPWSVEGLRRGAMANGWSVRVVRDDQEWMGGNEKIVVFMEDNSRAVERLRDMEKGALGRVSHVNGGLLPTSSASWKMSSEILDGDGWLHLHENVGVHHVERRRGEIEEMFGKWLKNNEDKRQARIEHVEFVKTFAPGVWHCVFDLYISNH